MWRMDGRMDGRMEYWIERQAKERPGEKRRARNPELNIKIQKTKNYCVAVLIM